MITPPRRLLFGESHRVAAAALQANRYHQNA